MRLLILLTTIIGSATYNVFRADNNLVQPNHDAPAAVSHVASGVSDQISALTKNKWVMYAITSDKPCDTDGDGQATTDIFSETPECAKDDIMMLFGDHTATFKRNLCCSLEEQAQESYTWKLGDNGLFTLSKEDYEAPMVLKSVSHDRLVMEIPMEVQGEMFTFTVSYRPTQG